MHNWYLVCLLSFTPFFLFSQTVQKERELFGKVDYTVNSDLSNLFASIEIYERGKLLLSTSADMDGYFNMYIRCKECIIQVRCQGYEDFVSLLHNADFGKYYIVVLNSKN